VSLAAKTKPVSRNASLAKGGQRQAATRWAEMRVIFAAGWPKNYSAICVILV